MESRPDRACYPWASTRRKRAVAEYKEVVHERLYLKVPGGEQLRKTSAGRLKHMLADGWRETQRWDHPST